MSDVGNDLSVGWFLLEFGVAIAVVCGLTAIWREWTRRRFRGGHGNFRLLDQYETAWLRGGERAAIGTAVANLVRRGALILDRDDSQRVHLQDFAGVSHPLEVDVLNAVARYGSLHIEQIPYATVTSTTQTGLLADGLIAPPGLRWWSFLPAVFVMPAIVYVGAYEVLGLIAAGLPVMPVVLLTVAGAYSVGRLCLPMHRTRRGDAVLRRLEQSAPRRDLVSSLLAIRLGEEQRQVA